MVGQRLVGLVPSVADQDDVARADVVPGVGALPFGLNIGTTFELAELKVQWLLLDFGRRLGRYEQAKLAFDVAQLQTDRAAIQLRGEEILDVTQQRREGAIERLRMRTRLREAIAREEYEEAARLRDLLRQKDTHA